MKNSKIFTLAAALFLSALLSACGGKPVDVSKPEFAVGNYWESLATENADQFLQTVGDPKTGKALDEQSKIFFKERFPRVAQNYKGKIKTITVTEVKYDESKTMAKVRVSLERFDGTISNRRMMTVKDGNAWHLLGAHSGASGFEAIGEAFGALFGG